MNTMAVSTSSFQNLVYDFHQAIRPLDVKLIYEGEINHEIMKVFTGLTEKGLKSEEFRGQKKVFNVMVECLQNISKHSDCLEGIKQDNIGNGIFLISNNDKELTIVTGNIITEEKEQFLSKKINYINTLNPEELRAFYKKSLRESNMSSLGGAGLGFIDIARKTKNKLEFTFHPVKEGYSFFIMSAKVNK